MEQQLHRSSSALFLLSSRPPSSDHLAAAAAPPRALPRPAAGAAQPSELLALAKSQVTWTTFWGATEATSCRSGTAPYPREAAPPRRRPSVSIKASPSFVSWQPAATRRYHTAMAAPNLLDGAIVGGPDEYDKLSPNDRNNEQTEATTYNNAPFMGVLARLAAGRGFTQSLAHHHEAAATAIKSDNQTSLTFPSHATEHASPIEIEQNATTSWTQRGKTYRRYAVTVTNRSGKTVHELHIGVSNLYGRLWGLDKARYGYVLPTWLPSLPAGKSASFVYIHAAPPADVWVTGYKLV
ncbi:hypothetical protein PR202_gb27149 [Eleusine coracana subsp. coracana]|uniref:cellulase n=1 Tax=Eleusine coracana subsp. coracana TaxID=191504 RepID=A0AAV5FTR5_ELECO|nr:hypothetical protein PR202_gb27149 [Eleusine coracana subsp. coracana]